MVAGPIVGGFGLNAGSRLLSFVTGFFIAGVVWSVSVAAISSLSGTLFSRSILRVLSFCSALLLLYFAVIVFLHGFKELIA